jgi:hypothetical protein
VIGLESDPAEALSDEQIETIRFLEGRIVTVGAPGTACDAVDVDGTYTRWLRAIDARYVVLRPDFYVAATAKSPEGLRHRFDEVISHLHLTKAAQTVPALAA